MLEEDAREDWISRGFDMNDFSLKKMTAIWDTEEKEDVKRAKKLKVIQHKHKPLTEDIKRVVTKVSSELQHASETVRETLRQFEPVILRDRRWLREHVAVIYRMDDECTKYKLMKVTNHAKFMATAKTEQAKNVERHERIEHKAPLLRRLREMKEEADKRDRAQATEELEWKYWHDLEMEEKDRYVSQAQTHNDAHIAYKRKMNMQYWKSKLKDGRREAVAVRAALDRSRAMHVQHAVQDVVDGLDMWEAEEGASAAYGTLRRQTESSLGVFGGAPGAFSSLDDDDELDPPPELEKIDRLRVLKANAVDDRKCIVDKKAGVVRGLSHAKAAHREVLVGLAGPPRREPADADRRYIHSLLKQAADLSAELKELSIRDRLLTERLTGWTEEEHAVAEQLAHAAGVVGAMEAAVADMDKAQNDLPMVVGRSIAHTVDKTMTWQHQHMLPRETLEAVTQRTKLELLKAAAMPAFQLYEQARYLGLESWKLSKQKMVDQAELELTVHRLAKIQDTLTKQQSLNQRSDVINALQNFHIAMVKPRDMDVDAALFTPEDRVTVSFGLTSGTVGQIGSFSAIDDNGRVRTLSHSIVQDYVGSRLSYCIEFFRSSTSTMSHTVVVLGLAVAGTFTQDDDTAADANPQSAAVVHHAGGGSHVLSEYVKMLRVQAQQGNHRCASLLEELIKVELSDADVWDSNVLHGHAQRFPRLMLDYRHRKSEHIEVATSTAREMVGQRVQLHGRDDRWQQGIVLGMRVEWKEGGTKLDISHQVTVASNTSTWVNLAQNVLVANDMAPLVVLERREKQVQDEKWKEILAQKLDAPTKSLLEIEQEYTSINTHEDAQFENAQALDLIRRQKAVTHDAQRTCTYDPQVVSLLEVEARRLMQSVNHPNVITFDVALHTLKSNYIRQTVDARMEFIKKTWARKNKRRLDKRKADRDQRKRKYDHSHQQVLELTKDERLEQENAAKQQQADAHGAALRAALQIPHFHLAVAPEPPCAHRELKQWGAKYDKGVKCKQCGKEMSRSFDDVDAARGADPALDHDVEMHRLFEASFRFENAEHLRRVEDERVRLEKEARQVQLAEVHSYDSTHMKAIDALNFRHVMGRNMDDRDGPRNDRDRHVAAYRDELSFFGRVNQYRYRLRILQDLRGVAYKERLIE
ncbi:hypothetical protein DYB36_008793, partial [Aphanomyces astaci]